MFAAAIGQDIDERKETSGGRKAVVDRKLRTVLDECGGWKRRGSDNVPQIIAALKKHGIYTDRDLADDRLTLDSYLWFGRHPIRRREIGPLGRRSLGPWSSPLLPSESLHLIEQHGHRLGMLRSRVLRAPLPGG
jgi:hypothetical protein